MTKQKRILLSVLLGSVLLPATAMSHHYQKTSGYQGLLGWAGSLNGISFNDASYIPYCDQYAQVSVNQAKRRVNQQCANAIPTNTPALKNRWSANQWGHKGWCRSVSAHASRAELTNRENGLKACLNNHTQTKAQIRQNCLANDNLHKKAASGDMNFVKKCLNAGVSVNAREGNQWTPLHSAARNGRINMAKLLISRGALLNARDVNARTPLDQAHAGNYISMQNYLRNMGGIRR